MKSKAWCKIENRMPLMNESTRIPSSDAAENLAAIQGHSVQYLRHFASANAKVCVFVGFILGYYNCIVFY